MSFDQLGLSPKVLSAVTKAGYSEPTPIQVQAIPEVLKGRDIIGIAQTGTGKTASFVLPMLTKLETGRARARMPRTLILEPTRELAAQVDENFQRYGIEHKLTVALLIGGVSFDEQDKKLDRGADVLIATPGRLLDHFERGKLLLTGVDVLVIDEADRMLDMGFIPDIERICRLVPFTRQTLFFSATMPPEIAALTHQFLQGPVTIEVARPATAAATVEQRWIKTSSTPKDKRASLRDAIRAEDGLTNAIIFCNRKRDVATLHRSLLRHGFNAGALHGDMDQRARMDTLARFKADELTLLVASDVAARGLDIPAVSHVFNFDVPVHADDYVHRIGRTGRAGRSGVSITLATNAEEKHVGRIETLIGVAPVWHTPDRADQEEASPEARRETPKRGGRDRRSRSKKADKPETVARDGETKADDGRKPRRSDESAGKRNKDRGDRQPDKPVVGLGDHVPAFLLRSAVRRADT